MPSGEKKNPRQQYKDFNVNAEEENLIFTLLKKYIKGPNQTKGDHK